MDERVFEGRSLDEAALSAELTLAETVIIWPCPMKGNGGNFSYCHAFGGKVRGG